MCPCNPSSPCSRPIFIHWLTAPCVTPNASAMSFWLHPCSESSHARRRRHSFQSPRCSSVFLMPPVYHTLATHVEVSKNLVCNAVQSVATARITFEDRLLVFVPLYHIYGIMLMGLAAMTGARLVLMERFEAGRCLQLIQEQSITILYSVPQVLAVLNDWPRLHDYDLHTVRFTQCGAAPVPPALARRFEQLTHIPVMTSYGLTEASPGTHSNPVYDPRLMHV